MKVKKGTEFKFLGNTATVMAVDSNYVMAQVGKDSPPFVVRLFKVTENIEK